MNAALDALHLGTRIFSTAFSHLGLWGSLSQVTEALFSDWRLLMIPFAFKTSLLFNLQVVDECFIYLEEFLLVNKASIVIYIIKLYCMLNEIVLVKC